MSAKVPSSSSSLVLSQGGNSESVQQGGNLQDRDVKVVYKDDFETYKTGLKDAFGHVVSEDMERNKKVLLYGIVGVVCIVAAIAIVCYLNIVLPATYVWPEVSKYLVAGGIAALFLGGVFLLDSSAALFREGSDCYRFSSLVDGQSRNVVFYRGNSAQLCRQPK